MGGQATGFSPETVEELVDTMRSWYNGYRFCPKEEELVYNPTNVLYFVKHLYLEGEPPQKLHDQNLRTDRGKLTFLARTNAGTDVVERLTAGGDDVTIELSELETSFSLEDLTKRTDDDQFVASLLYYMGLLTQTRTRAEESPRLRIPNLVVRQLFLDRLLEISGAT